MSDPLSRGDAAYRASLRRHTLNQLRYAPGGEVNDDGTINVSDDLAQGDPVEQQWRRLHKPKITVNPTAPTTVATPSTTPPQYPLTINPRNTYSAPDWSPALQPDEPPTPPQPAPAPPPDTTFKPDRDLQLGFQAGAADLARMLYKPGEGIYGGHLAGGKPLSEAVTENLAPNQEEMAARSGNFQRALQFVGRAPADTLRYTLPTIAAGGNAILGGYAAEALGADTPQEAEERGAMGAVLPGIFHELPGLATELKSGLGQLGRYLPTQEELQTAGAAADARLRSRGFYQTSGMGAGAIGDNVRDLAVSTGAQLGSGMYAVGEAAQARARQVRDWITNKQTTELTPQEQDLFHQAQQTSPELAQAAPHMLPDEVRKVIASPANMEAFSRLIQALPQDYQLAAAAKMGAPKLGWYFGSAHAIQDIFGEDAPRFAQLLAAMSPRTSVESNLFNALNVWKNWIAEGRPTDEASILAIMGRSVQGGTEKSALHVWRPNTVSALSAADPMTVTLSGPKVDSFYHDLRNDVFKLAQDAWMANTYGIDQTMLQGAGANVLAGNPGMTPEYAAANARLRSAGLQAGMLPTQGQETTWSTGMQLYELAKKLKMDPRDVLQRGLLTPQIVAGATDFSRLFREPRYADILKGAGYEPQLSALQPAPPVRIASTPQQLARQSGRVMPASGVRLSPAEQQAMMEMAGNLAETRGMRQRITRAAQFPVGQAQPTSLPGNLQMEWYPGADTGIYPEIQPPNPRLPYESASSITSRFMTPFENVRGQNAFLTHGLETIPTRNVVGAFTPPSGIAEISPGRSYGFTAPLTRTPEGNLAVDPQAMANARAAGSWQSLLLGQQATGIPVMLENPHGEDFTMRLPEKPPTTPQEVQALQQAYPKKAIIHTGPRLHVLNLDDVKMDEPTRKNMISMMRATEGTRATNIGDYFNDANAWAKAPGSGEATQLTIDRYNQATPEMQAGLDQDVRYAAGKLLEGYRQKVRTQGWTLGRPDWENLLETAAKQGIPGVIQGIRSGAFFPALAGALLLPRLLKPPEDSSKQPAEPNRP